MTVTSASRRSIPGAPALIAIVLAAFAVRMYFAPWPGHVVDIATGEQWSVTAASAPWSELYPRTNSQLPPAGMLHFELVGWLYRVLHVPPEDDVTRRVIFKLPGIAFDVLCVLLTYALVRRYGQRRTALTAAALYAFNPAMIYESGYWGQNDGMTGAFMIAALWLAACGRRFLAWPSLVYAALTKPHAIVIAPLFVIEPLLRRGSSARRRALYGSALGVVAALVLGYLLTLPFYPERSPIAVYGRLIAAYASGSSVYPYTTVNAFNLYALFNDFFVSDSVRILFIPAKYWGDALFAVTVILVCWRYEHHGGRGAMALAAFLILLGFYLFMTEMHERYGIFALMLAPAVALLDRRLIFVYVAFTLATWLNFEYAINYIWIESQKTPGLNTHEFAPVLVHLCALASLGAFFTAAYVFATGKADGLTAADAVSPDAAQRPA